MSPNEDTRIKHTSDQFMGAGERLHLQAWLPAAPDPAGVAVATEPAAVIALVHGYGDHGGRHTWFGEDMAARGYAVYAYDLRGHGQSSGTRGQIKRFDDYLDDTAIFLDEVRRRQPGKPVVLLGHSLGGLICTRFAQERPCDVRALVLSSPFFALTVQPEPMKLLGAKALSSRLAGPRHRQHRAGPRTSRTTARWWRPTSPTRSCTTWPRRAGRPRP